MVNKGKIPMAQASAIGSQEEKNELQSSIKDDFVSANTNKPQLLRKITWASSFIGKENGIYKYKTKDDTPIETWLFSPLYVVAFTCDANGKNWGVLLHIKSPDNNWHEVAIPSSTINGYGSSYREIIFGLGLRIAPNAYKDLHTYITTANPNVILQSVSKVGWHGKTYVLPNEVFGEDDCKIILQTNTTENHFRTRGSLNEWQNNIGRLCIGNSRLTLAACASLAAPLLYPLGLEGGGIHFVGHSSIGKSVTLLVAGSIAGGGGVNGFLRRWRATDNAIESIATAHNDAVLCLDEINQVSAKVASEVSYMLANGQGKSRANKDGIILPTHKWQLIFLSNGELSLEQKLLEDNRRHMAGQAVRVLDIPADAQLGYGVFENLHNFSSGKCLAEHLQTASQKYYGTPFRAFLRCFTQNITSLSCKAKSIMQNYELNLCQNTNDGQINRAAKRFALLAAAGELASQLNVFPWPSGIAYEAANRCFNDWVRFRGGLGPHEVRTTISRIRSFIAANRTSRFEPWAKDSPPKAVHDSVGFWRETGNELEFMFMPDAFKKEVCLGYVPDNVAKMLDSMGFLRKDNSGKSLKKTHTPPRLGKSVRMYTISGDILNSDD